LERFPACDTLASSRKRENLVRLVRGIFAPEVCLNLCLFHFTQNFSFRKFTRPLTPTVLTFYASVANRLRQAVCKTVAVSLWKFKSSPMHFNFGFWIVWVNPKIKIQKDFCERNSNWLSAGLPNRMLRVRFPSLTLDICDFQFSICDLV
jgi:hypothetical protein